MTNSGDAAEQIVRLSLDGIDHTLKIAGGAAKQIAAFLMAALQSDGKDKQNKVRLEGRETLKKFLKSGKETTIFTIKDADRNAFENEARNYGLAYCELKNKDGKSGKIEVMAKAEDAPKINHIIEKLKLSEVDRTFVKTEKTAKETIKAEKKTAKKKRRQSNKKANKAHRGKMREARKKANQEIRKQRKESRGKKREQSRAAYAQYRQEIGRPIKVKQAKQPKQPKKPKERSETAKLFVALIASITKNFKSEKGSPQQTKLIDNGELRVDNEAKSGKDSQSPAVEKSGKNGVEIEIVSHSPLQENPTVRTEKSPPSGRGSGSESKSTRATEGYLTKPPSVKAFLTKPEVRQTERQKSEKIRERRTGQKPTRRKQVPQKLPQPIAQKKAARAKGGRG